jgi:hypothetical protein
MVITNILLPCYRHPTLLLLFPFCLLALGLLVCWFCRAILNLSRLLSVWLFVESWIWCAWWFLGAINALQQFRKEEWKYKRHKTKTKPPQKKTHTRLEIRRGSDTSEAMRRWTASCLMPEECPCVYARNKRKRERAKDLECMYYVCMYICTY